MRILYLTRNLYPDMIGGVEFAVEALTAHMQALGHRVTIATNGLGRDVRRKLCDGRVLRGIGSVPAAGPLWRVEPVYRMAAMVAPWPGGRYDVVFTPDPPMGLVHLMRGSGAPLVYCPGGTVIGNLQWASGVNRCGRTGHVGRATFSPIERQQLAIERLVVQRARRVIAVSHRVRDQMVGQHAGCAGRVRVIHNGYQPHDDPTVRLHRSDETPIARDDAFTAVCVARLDPIKNIAHLLHAWSRMTTQRRRLLIAGDGPQRGELAALIDRLGVGGSVHLLGARLDVPQLLDVADVLVLPSRYEACGTVVVEALAAGVPCVTLANRRGVTAVGASGEINVDGVTGFCTDPRDPSDMARRLDLLAGDRALARRLGHAGRRSVGDALTWRNVAKRYLAVADERVTPS